MKSLLPLALVLLLLLAGCGSIGNGTNTNQYFDADRAKYFQGTNGAEARYQQFPERLYYFANAPQSSANDFPFSVEVMNKGASYTRGAVFISGFDPNLIQIDEVPVGMSAKGACGLRFGDFSLNQFGMTLQCGDNALVKLRECDGAGLPSTSKLPRPPALCLDSLSLRGKTWFKDSILENLIFNMRNGASGTNYNLVLDDATFTFDQREHGILLIAILQGLSYRAFLGQEYLLAGNTYDYPGGELDYIDFNAHIVSWPSGTDEIPQSFLLTNCYMYTTFAAPMVCIDPQPYSENRKVCKAGVTTWKSSQGAPVAITQVTQENTPRKAIFHVTVKNVGGGTVFDPGQLEKCSPYYPGGAKMSDQNIVWVGEARIGDTKLDCTPETELRLQNGQASFTCSYSIEFAELNTAYQTPLVIELWYGYSKTVEKRISVKRVT